MNNIKQRRRRLQICWVKKSYYMRYKYYGTSTKFTGTIFTELRNKTISDSTDFYNNSDIQTTVNRLESRSGVAAFWILWTILIVFIVFIFVYYDNRWLE